MLFHLTNRKPEKEQGFTLVELLVVILIIGILAAIAIPMFLNQRKAAVDAGLQSDVKQLIASIETRQAKYPNLETPNFALRPADTDHPLGSHNAGGLAFTPSPDNYIKVFRSSSNGNTGYCISAWNAGASVHTNEDNPLQYSSHHGIIGQPCFTS